MINNLSKPALSLPSKTFASAVLVFILLTAGAYANNIAVTNIKLTGQNISGQYTLVQFDISWENSWRTSSAPYNYDAAWVFVKYRIPVTSGGDGLWKHAWFNDAGHTAPSGCTVDIGLHAPSGYFNPTTNPGLGAFIYRDANGTGAFTKTGVQLRWNYGANSVADNAVVDIQVFAIEMVYVPQGNFQLGSGGTEEGHFYKYSTTTDTYSVSTEAAITIGTATGNLYYPSGTNTGDRLGPIPAAFPKGYNAFYCMKYEISQQEYVDFLNTLTYIQQETRTVNAPSSAAGTAALINAFRNGIDIQTPGVISTTPAVYACNLNGNVTYGESVDGQWIACNYLSWTDLEAYLDWSGLRPMTELEFEKSCRGTLPAVANEYAWGTTGIAGSAYTLSNSGANNEVIATNYSTTVGNAAYLPTIPAASINGPLRVGIFAGTSGNTGRITAGAAYYGIMEMSGNLWERSVTVGNAAGRLFTSTNGNGLLNATGNADVTTWPGTSITGSGFRGGVWNNNNTYLPVSCRYQASGAYDTRLSYCGGRGVRSPFSCGSSFTITHTIGTVSPETKSVNYGTVITSLSGASKCWITQNLGSTNQATSATDATDAAAGWYWQFNRMQGYKHDGTTRTPNSVWITSISENSNWLTANDPCTIELGAGWRIPTHTEWANADATGAWANYTDTYNSVLKLHAAGFLNYSNGSLSSRGSLGFYWNSTQNDANTFYGWYLFFSSGTSLNDYRYKACGQPLRCLKDCTEPPTTADAGPDIILAAGVSTYTLAGNTPTIGTGLWSVISGTATITTPGSPTSGVTGLASSGTAKLRWTISNSPFTPSTDDVIIITIATPCIWNGSDQFTFTHTIGTVAPETKTVTYGQTQTSLSGASKCWITQNLGASHQACSADDATEPSAGWYWQFNHMQGYKHDGTTRTPNNVWITSISENSNWLAANDPCTIELGAGWRIPASTEWLSADGAPQNWINYIDTYNSVLKLHAAGLLYYPDGVLNNIGTYGGYWSSTQNSNAYGRNWGISSSYSTENYNYKANGFSLRCLKDEVVATVTTTAVSAITSTTATSGGNVTANGGATVTARGVCWNTSPNPTTANSYTTNGSGTGVFVSDLTSLTPITLYYVRAYATNNVGTAYGNEVSFTTALVIGDSYQGGKVAYILQPTDPGYVAGETHGLIAAPSDQSSSSGAVWGCYMTTISGADGTAIGTGNQNTIDIMAGCSTAGIAARLCGDLVLGGYSDWYLPSKDELEKICLNRAAIGGFTDGAGYWSSSEVSNYYAWFQYPYGYQSNNSKEFHFYVRAVRAF